MCFTRADASIIPIVRLKVVALDILIWVISALTHPQAINDDLVTCSENIFSRLAHKATEIFKLAKKLNFDILDGKYCPWAAIYTSIIA
jgi:hypothetical protein